MKLPEVLTNFFHKKPQQREVFLSLLLDVDMVSAAAWTAEKKGMPTIIKTSTREVKEDSWDQRTKAADHVIGSLDEVVGPEKLTSVVLGLPPIYLTDTGDITPEVRGEIKKLTKVLELTPIGFVPIHQAIAHTFKRDEGVPPTVILIGVGKSLTIALYKVGALVGMKIVSPGETPVVTVEKTLKSFTDVEILPSRMLLYGGSRENLAQMQAQLLRHPWQMRANFLHFPKIEVLPTDFPIAATCVAGATEISKTMGEETVEEGSGEPEEPQESNVMMVAPEELGFQKKDILEREADVPPDTLVEKKETEEPAEPKKHQGKFSIPALKLPKLQMAFRLPVLPGRGIWVIGGVVFLAFVLFWVVRWVIPRASVTILTIANPVSATETLTVDPTATIADAGHKIIPGKKQEQSVNGEKTIQVTGKKKVGDPAKGTVTVFNKSTLSRSFKKGSVLVSNALQFILSEDVTIASASENLVSGTVTFGKTDAALTASEIGTQSNLPAGTEFSFKDVSNSIAIARNDQPLSGGISRDVTVVSRADYDALTKALTGVLVENAKKELSSGVSGTEKLIDETIDTRVAQKDFSQEINQEATELHGKLTLTVSGISYSEDDVKTILKEEVTKSVAQGYTLDEGSLSATISKAQVEKDGSIVVTATLSGHALPSIDIPTVQKQIAGKSLEEAQNILKAIGGVGAVEFKFYYALSKNRLPSNKHNISITVAVGQ